MTTFGTEFQLSSLTGLNGFKISGAAAGDHAGISVASAGDVNGDGLDDIIVGASSADPNGSSSGATYVVFGRAGGFAANVNLATLNGSNGFRISGLAADDLLGSSVASAGDVNGDGFDDLIVGVPQADPNGNGSGASYVVFGHAGGFAANLNPATLNGSSGFRIDGPSGGQFWGDSVASAGDVNGDGFDDLLVGSLFGDAAYVVFGRAGGFVASLNLGLLNGSNGFRINAEVALDFVGRSVAAAGDVNGDGFDDVIVGAPGSDANGVDSGASYVVFGHAGSFSAAINLSTLNGTNGFQISGEAGNDRFGTSVASAGDINGDGFDDLVVGATGADPNGNNAAGASYVVFGRAGGFGTNLDLSTLDGTNGFQINGEAALNASGGSVASAGDVNGDGFDDLLVGASGASPNGGSSGASYLVLGRAGGFIASLNLSTLDGANGLQLSGEAAGDQTGQSVASGDVNGDGFDDMIVGAWLADANGADSGAAYVVFGKATRGSAGNDVLDASGASDTLSGLDGNDTIRGNGGNDTLAGGAGNDLLDGGAGTDQLFGGAGNDTYALAAEASGADAVTDADGIDTITSTISRSLAFGAFSEIENLTLTGGSVGTGNAMRNVINGNAAANTLNGLVNVDTLVGGAANDTYVMDSTIDTVVEAAGAAAGTADHVVFTGLTNQIYVLAANVERLTLVGTAGSRGTGNILANIMTGNAGANSLNGGFANDVLNGGAGNDTLDGGAHNDTLLGLAGNDILIGNLGRDVMTGGLGNDVFRFAAKSHSTVGAKADVIKDFDDFGNDRIDVSGLFGAAMTYRHNLAFTGAGQVRINDIAGADVLVEVNTGGTLAADFAVRLAGTTLASMAANDFFL
jgi:hypothetical protein